MNRFMHRAKIGIRVSVFVSIVLATMLAVTVTHDMPIIWAVIVSFVIFLIVVGVPQVVAVNLYERKCNFYFKKIEEQLE